MTTRKTSTPATVANGRVRGGPTLIVAAVGFVLLYLSVDLVAPNLATSALPLPNAPAGEARAWFAENQLAAVVIGVCQFLSVSALAVFVTRLKRLAGASGQAAATRAAPWGLAAVALMMVASVAAWLLAAVASNASLDVVSALRTANFVAGGTAHVLTLGVYAVLASRIPGMSKPVRALSYVAATPAVLSVVSLVWFQAAAFILLGRLLCMAWTVSTAVSSARRLSKGAWA